MSQESIIVEPTEIPIEDNVATADEAPAVEEETAVENPVPDKYKGKTFQDIVEMHQNLETEYGRQSNEVGAYRELVSSFADSKVGKPEADTTTPSVEVTSDSLWDDPQAAITSVVKAVLQNELAPIKQSQAQQSEAQMLANLHREFPDAEQVGNDPAFAKFVESSPYRLADAQRWMDTKDVDSARRLLSEFKAQQPVAPSADAPSRGVEEARKASTETGRGGSGATSKKKFMYRDAVIKMIANDPERYRSEAFQEELRVAIEEGRFKS